MPVEIPRRGIRGTKLPMPPAPLKAPMLWLYERVQRLKGSPVGHLTTIGARSGQERVVPVRPFVDGPDSWFVVASLGGAAQNPAWLHNLKAHPEQVTFSVGDSTFPVEATTLAGDERDEVWQRIVRAAPRFEEYQRNTDRVIPVVRLSRRTT